MILKFAKIVVELYYPAVLICIFVILVGIIWLLDIAYDITYKRHSRKVNANRARRCMKLLKNMVVTILLFSVVALAALIDLKAAGEDYEIIKGGRYNEIVRVLQSNPL